MIDLSVMIRKYLLTIPEFTSIIADYQGDESIFNFRPVPEDAPYPMAIISSALGGADSDYVNCFKRDIPYHVTIYSKIESGNDYKKIENLANLVARSFHRIRPSLLEVPQGVNIVSVTASNPFIAPTDDNSVIARAININFEVKY